MILTYLKRIIFASVVIGLAGPIHAQSPQTLSVSSFMDIWQSGGYNDGSGGSAPAVYTFPAAPGQALTFSSVTGSGTCNYGVPQYGPDGTTSTSSPSCYTQASNYSPTGPFSGLDLVDFQGPLVGMFLGDSLPASAPPTLTFYVSNISSGGVRINFGALSPQLGQVFFIGDGKTGTGTGAIQVFNVPPTATHLYLGYADSCDYATPGCYGDNEGSMTATFAISACSFQVSGVTPELQLTDRAWATQAGIMLSWKSGKPIGGAAASRDSRQQGAGDHYVRHGLCRRRGVRLHRARRLQYLTCGLHQLSIAPGDYTRGLQSNGVRSGGQPSAVRSRDYRDRNAYA